MTQLKILDPGHFEDCMARAKMGGKENASLELLAETFRTYSEGLEKGQVSAMDMLTMKNQLRVMAPMLLHFHLVQLKYWEQLKGKHHIM